MNLFELTTALMSIPSTSGEEEAVGFWLRDYLHGLGWNVEMQAVGEERTGASAFRSFSILTASS